MKEATITGLILAALGISPFPVTRAQGQRAIIVLLEHVEFGSAGTFGGVVPMPVLDRLAAGRLRYNNLRGMAHCSPGVALKTGRNHHTAEAGFMEIATSVPGNTGQLRNG